LILHVGTYKEHRSNQIRHSCVELERERERESVCVSVRSEQSIDFHPRRQTSGQYGSTVGLAHLSTAWNRVETAVLDDLFPSLQERPTRV